MLGDNETDEQLTAKVLEGDDAITVALDGELDLASVDVFTSAIDDALTRGHDSVTLDWSGLSFIDSSGVGAYVQVFRKAQAAGVRLVVGPRSDVVQRVLDLSGVEDALGEEAADA